MAENEETRQVVKPLFTEATWGFLVLRFWIALRMIFAGAQKFYAKTIADPDTGELSFGFSWNNWKVTAMDNVYAAVKNNSFLPPNPSDFLRKVCGMKPEKIPAWLNIEPGLWFAYALPWLLLVFGFTLLLGILPRTSLFVAAFTFMMLSIGMFGLGDTDGINHLGIHIGLTAVALLLVRHSRFNLTRY